MRVLVAPMEFKGTLTATAAAEAISAGLRRARPKLELDLLPLADGGPGTLEALRLAMKGVQRTARAHDALGREIEAEWAVVEGSGKAAASENPISSTPAGRCALIEMAAAAGLSRVAPDERRPLLSSTRGVGELITAALDAGCAQLIVGLGGSATNDGGAGMLAALGARFLAADGRPVADGGAALLNVAKVDLSGLDPRLKTTRLFAAADVTAPLLGPQGATRVFGAQKGANGQDLDRLEAALRHWSGLVESATQGSWRETPGTGAAGGLGFALGVLGAQLRPGFELISEASNLPRRISEGDVVVTGEGRLDAQTSMGKGPARLATLARASGKKIAVFAGTVAPDAPAQLFDWIVQTGEGGVPSSAASAQRLLEHAVTRWADTTL